MGVEVAGRFVGDQHRRVIGKGAGDGDSLLLAARHRTRQPVAEEDDAHVGTPPPRERVLAPGLELLAAEDDATAGWAVEAGEHIEDGGLAAARGAVDREQAALGDREGHVVEDQGALSLLVEMPAQVFDLDERRHRYVAACAASSRPRKTGCGAPGSDRSCGWYSVPPKNGWSTRSTARTSAVASVAAIRIPCSPAMCCNSGVSPYEHVVCSTTC